MAEFLAVIGQVNWRDGRSVADQRNTVGRLVHGGAITLRHYASSVSDVDRLAAGYLAQFAGPSSQGTCPIGLTARH